jgi:hypothetical protein
MADTDLVDGILPGQELEQKFFKTGDPRVLDWAREAIQEGDRIMKQDPAYPKMDAAMSYVLGEQLAADRPSYLPKLVINQSKKSVRASVSALTDLKPVFAYKTYNPQFQPVGDLLNNLVVAWWVNTFADLELADVIKYSKVAGTGDCLLEYDPHFNHYGDNRLIARDPRDTIPVRPSRDRSIQSWEGVIIREAHSPNVLRGMFPGYAPLLQPEFEGSKFGSVFTKFRRTVASIVTPTVFDYVSGGAFTQRGVTSPEITLFRMFLTDRSLNMTGGPILMGKPGTAWSYMVKPKERLYPRKRLIVLTDKAVLYDGPSPYWHGMYPVSRLKLDNWPWLFFGLSQIHDTMPLQDSINQVMNDFLSTFSQWVNRGVIADKNSIPESLLKRFDPRKPNWKMKLNPTYGEGFKLADGPTLPPWSMDFLALLLQKHDDLTGTANLQQLMQLRQMPGADTIQKYWEALTPELRQEGRVLEGFLRDIAEMIKVNIFQYYSAARRIGLLGDVGITLNDFDYDPGTLVPSLSPGNPGYTPELDVGKSRDERAQFFMRLFSFHVAPNSILAMNAMEKKMEAFQMARMGYMDFWTFHERMETPNVGTPPPIPLPALDQPDPVLIGALPGQKKYFVDPQTGITMEVRVPSTITERLIAQATLGIGMTQNPAGRKASGQAPPQIETKSDEVGAPRTTITES